MYDFVDQPVTRLEPGGKFLLWAMRGWIHAASRGGCPPGQLAPAFARHGALPALPHLHRLVGTLNRHATQRITFLPLDCPVIGDDEAVLLQLWRDARDAPCRAQAALDLLLDPECAADAMTALLAAVTHLDGVGLAHVAMAD